MRQARAIWWRQALRPERPGTQSGDLGKGGSPGGTHGRKSCGVHQRDRLGPPLEVRHGEAVGDQAKSNLCARCDRPDAVAAEIGGILDNVTARAGVRPTRAPGSAQALTCALARSAGM